MKEFEPKGTPQANEEAKQKLESMLTPQERKELGLDIESEIPQNMDELYDPVLESDLQFLLELNMALSGWEERFTALKSTSEPEKKSGCKILYKEIVDNMEGMKSSINLITQHGGHQEKSEYFKLNERLVRLKAKILEIINPSASHETI